MCCQVVEPRDTNINRPPVLRPSHIEPVPCSDTALVTHPCLQVGSKLLVQARYRQRSQHDRDEKVHEFVADHILFMDKIDWERGDAARAQLRAERT